MITIVPDIHGHDFWRQAADAAGDGLCSIFLGDYLDPYPLDISWGKTTVERALDNFKEIIELKKSAPDKVVLLLGNHDCQYLYGLNVCDCRCDKERFDEIRTLFRSNANLFQMAWDITLRRKHYLFTHAGISTEWLERHLPGWNPGNIADKLNEANSAALKEPHPEQTEFAAALAERDIHRCGQNSFASPVWLDAEILASRPTPADIIQVVGHTKCRHSRPVFVNSCRFLDCDGYQWFKLNEYGTLRDRTGEICRNEYENPLNPPGDGELDEDCFGRPFCRKCGSRKIYIHAGIMADVWHCTECGAREVM